jgi:serine/threonine protein kinase
VQVLTHVAERLKDLHAAGYVHRDIKPGNIMWLPRKNRWTLIDFGCAAPTGSDAPIGFTLMYGAPEVVAAHSRSEPSIKATEALDGWSVGILALEMFSGRKVFDMSASKAQVRDALISVPPSGQRAWPAHNCAKSKTDNSLYLIRGMVTFASRSLLDMA